VHGIPCGGPCLYTGVSVNIPTHHHGCAHTFLTSLKNSMVVVTLMARKKTLSFESVWVTEAGGVLLGVWFLSNNKNSVICLLGSFQSLIEKVRKSEIIKPISLNWKAQNNGEGWFFNNVSIHANACITMLRPAVSNPVALKIQIFNYSINCNISFQTSVCLGTLSIIVLHVTSSANTICAYYCFTLRYKEWQITLQQAACQSWRQGLRESCPV